MTVEHQRLTALSLGAGVQSTTLALMAAAGEIRPMPDCALFADTGWEPRAVYDHLDRLQAALPFPVHRVTRGSNIRDDILHKATGYLGRFAAVPFFTLDDGGKRGMGRRQCTKEYKLEPLTRKQRELMGVPRGRRVPKGQTCEVWIGISTDEAQRMKPAWKPWQRNRWPLIEAGMSRRDCQRWLAAAGWSAPKSACIGCPFHSDVMWRDMRDNAPDEWADAVEVDRLIRAGGTLRGMRAQQYLHAQRVPLDEVDLSTAEDRGQFNMFGNECEGMCGV